MKKSSLLPSSSLRVPVLALALASVLACVLAMGLASGAAAEPIVIGESETMFSKVLDEERTLLVRLPPGYEGSQTAFPVLYLLDARTRFHHTTGNLASLARSGHVPEMIVVAVVNTNRTRDLTPPWTGPVPEDDPQGRGPAIQAGGGADDFLRFIADELIPHVEGKYRTAPFRMLVGHSFGGLFAVHAFVSRPDLFDAVVAVSPSLWWDSGKSVDQAQELFSRRPDLEGRLFLTLASEGGDMLTEFQRMEALLHYRAPKGLQWEAHVLDGEDHGTIPISTVNLALRAFFPRWQIPPFVRSEGLDAVDGHYASLSKDYGYAIETPEALINNLGYQALGSGNLEEAERVFRANVERYPASANVYDSLGEALEAAGKLEEAQDLYRRAYELGEPLNDPNVTAYKQHLDAVTEKLAEGGR